MEDLIKKLIYLRPKPNKKTFELWKWNIIIIKRKIEDTAGYWIYAYSRNIIAVIMKFQLKDL